jgi:hypothetical protein
MVSEPMVVCGKVANLKKFLSQMESGNMVPFAVGAGMGCVYFEPTQVYIAQGKPNKSPHNDLGKRPNKESCQWV